MPFLPPATRTVLLVALVLAGANAASCWAAALVDKPRAVTAEAAPASASSGTLADYQQPLAIPFPASAPYTPAMARLGRALFFDARLSEAGDTACVSCHNPALSWTGGVTARAGEAVRPLPRRPPTIANLAWGDSFMWDGQFDSLEQQVFSPLESADEMHRPRDELPGVLETIPSYRALLAIAQPGAHFTPALVARAIATFERSVVYPPAPFDKWITGDPKAVPDAARRGFAVFNGRGGCNFCHSGWNFEDGGFHDIGLPDGDLGRGALFPNVVKLQHAFRTPGLRDIARRGPYMHDGALLTLDDVVAHYDQGGIDRASRSELVHRLDLLPQEKADLVAFLQSLTAGRDEVSIQSVSPDVSFP